MGSAVRQFAPFAAVLAAAALASVSPAPAQEPAEPAGRTTLI